MTVILKKGIDTICGLPQSQFIVALQWLLFFTQQSYDQDGYQFGQIRKLLDKSNVIDQSPTSPKSDSLFDWEDKPPPEAILPEEICDEVPVHDSEGR